MVCVIRVWFEEDKIFVELNDGHIVGTPISWYRNLSKGTKEQLQRFEIWSKGQWIHWEELDEDLSAEGFLIFNKEKVQTLTTR